jgi:hypothetical protein
LVALAKARAFHIIINSLSVCYWIFSSFADLLYSPGAGVAKEDGGKFDVCITTSAALTGELLGFFFKV